MRKNSCNGTLITYVSGHDVGRDKRILVLSLLSLFLVIKFAFSAYLIEEKATPSCYIIHGSKIFVQETRVQHQKGVSFLNTDKLPPGLSFFLNKPFLINKASKDELLFLPGIGPHSAKVIFRHLTVNSAVTGIDDLVTIPGIGPKTAKRLAPYLDFSL